MLQSASSSEPSGFKKHYKQIAKSLIILFSLLGLAAVYYVINGWLKRNGEAKNKADTNLTTSKDAIALTEKNITHITTLETNVQPIPPHSTAAQIEFNSSKPDPKLTPTPSPQPSPELSVIAKVVIVCGSALTLTTLGTAIGFFAHRACKKAQQEKQLSNNKIEEANETTRLTTNQH